MPLVSSQGLKVSPHLDKKAVGWQLQILASTSKRDWKTKQRLEGGTERDWDTWKGASGEWAKGKTLKQGQPGAQKTTAYHGSHFPY